MRLNQITGPTSLPKRTETEEALKSIQNSFIQFFSLKLTTLPSVLVDIIWEYWNELILSKQEYADLITGLGSTLDEKCLKPLDDIKIFGLENIELNKIPIENLNKLIDRLTQNHSITHFIFVKAYLTIWNKEIKEEIGRTSWLLYQVLQNIPRSLELIKIDMDYHKDINYSIITLMFLLESFQNQISLKKIFLNYTNLHGHTIMYRPYFENAFLNIFKKNNPRYTLKLQNTDPPSTYYKLWVDETPLGSFSNPGTWPDSFTFSM